MNDEEEYEFDVALSFAGEDRAYAKSLASLLKDEGVGVFYDEFSRATLWGKDLFQHLQQIYKDKARYCVVFVSEHYIRKNWTRHELQQAQARSFQADREYILPLKLDGSELPGVPLTIGYLDLRHIDLREVTSLLLEKLGRSNDQSLNPDRVRWEGELVEYNGMMVAASHPKRIEEAQYQTIALVTVPFERVRYGDEKRIKSILKREEMGPCRDCGVLPGQIHVPGCCIEECAACEGQAISCGCQWEMVTREQLAAWEEHEEY